MTRVKILITGLISVAIQFGLAIAGWGGWRAFWLHPQFRALAWVTAGLMLLAIFTQGGLTTGEKEDRGNRWVLAAFSVIALAMAFFSSYTDRIGFWTLDGDTLRWAGVVVCPAGGVLRIVPVYVLGKRFSGLVAIQPEHTLETGRHLQRDPQPQLPGHADHFAGMGAGIPHRRGRGAGPEPAGAARGAHERRGAAARASTLARSTTRISSGRGGWCRGSTKGRERGSKSAGGRAQVDQRAGDPNCLLTGTSPPPHPLLGVK